MVLRLFAGCLFALLPPHMGLTASPAVQAQQADVAGVKVKFVDYQGPATLSAKVNGAQTFGVFRM